MRDVVKVALPNRPIPVRILRGPFRGACVVINPRNSIRKILGLYEHELNRWVECALRRCNRILDVGANDGYFAFGCVAAFGRLGKTGEIIAFEPQEQHFDTLQQSANQQRLSGAKVTLVQAFVGGEVTPATTTLDVVRWHTGNSESRTNVLIKIDVEGYELEVLKGASSWINPTNYFVIEVHEEPFLESITQLFKSRDLRLNKVEQQPLPFLGRERRAETNWWLVSELK